MRLTDSEFLNVCSVTHREIQEIVLQGQEGGPIAYASGGHDLHGQSCPLGLQFRDPAEGRLQESTLLVLPALEGLVLLHGEPVRV